MKKRVVGVRQADVDWFMTNEEIAAQIGCSTAAVVYQRRRHGASKRALFATEAA